MRAIIALKSNVGRKKAMAFPFPEVAALIAPVKGDCDPGLEW